MADQCIVCLEPLDVEPSTAPLGPAEGQHPEEEHHHNHPPPLQNNLEDDHHQQDHERLAIEDAEALARTHQQKNGLEHINHDHVAQIEVCGHMLHDACLREWTDKANSCPICRQTFHVVNVYDKIGGKYLSTRRVEDKKQVPEFDPRAWADDAPEEPELPGSRCPVCNSGDHEEVLLLCDGCDAAYHTHCIDLDSVPVGPWFCMECVDAFGPDVIEPTDRPGREGARSGQRYYFPRTQASMRRARQRARSDEWQGAWGRITGRIWDALELDLDYQDDEDSVVFEGLRRSRQLRERERQEHERWQQRLNIASRLGARDVFVSSMPEFVTRPPPPQQTREERLAWGALEKARDMESRKRKSRSATAEPHEEQHHEPERKLKRPRTRRLLPQNGESSSSAVRDPGPSHPSHRQEQASPPATTTTIIPAATMEAQPSFLASLLKEVEMSTPSDEESLRNMFGPIPSVNDAPSPARSPSLHSQGSATPPHRASSPQMTLSSHIAPRYPPPNYSPTRGSPTNSVRPSRSSSPSKAPSKAAAAQQQEGSRGGQSSPETSDSEQPQQQRGRRPPPRPSASHQQHQQQQQQHTILELRQPQPRRVAPTAAAAAAAAAAVVRPARSRSQNASSPSSDPPGARSPLPFEVKESISRIVRSALKPHWRSGRLAAEQYEAINRDISRKIYEEVKDPAAVSEDMKVGWERRVTQEVARAVASLKA